MDIIPTVTEFIEDELRRGETDSSYLALKINHQFSGIINLNDAQELVENIKKKKSSTTFNYSRPSTSSSSRSSSRSSSGSTSTTTGNDFTNSRTGSNSSSAPSSNSDGENDRVSAEKKLINMRLEKERKKLLEQGALEDFLESKNSYLCPFEKCLNKSLSAEEYKQLHMYAVKNRTYLLYYLYIGLDLERIYLMMNELECKPEKVKRKLEKLVRENHPIMMEYSLKNTVNVGYFKKAEQILETKKEPGFVDKIFKLISGGGNDNNASSQKSSSSNQGKGNNTSQKNHSNQHSTKPSTSTAQSQSPSTIDLSSLNSDSDIVHKMVSFKHDDTRKVYIMKSSKSFNGKSEVVLRKKNYDFIANQMKGQSMPASINGKVDWADFSGTNLEVGASCKF